MTETDFTKRLNRGERILWQGQPARGLRPTPSEGSLLPFSMFFLVFSVCWTGFAMFLGPNFFFLAIGSFFVLFGLYIAIGRFFVDALARARTRYLLTSERLVILRDKPFATTLEFPLAKLADPQVIDDGNGRTTLNFGPPIKVVGNNRVTAWTPALEPLPVLIGIDRAATMLESLRTARRREQRA